LQELLKAVVTFVVVGAAGTATLQVLASWSDGFSVDVIDHVAGGMKLQAAFGGTSHDLFATAMPSFVAIMTGLAVIVASAVQIVLMLIRSAMLVLLAGAFPLAAAATNTEIGRNWFKKFCGWSLAFVAYKPAAALVYAAAMKMAHDQPSSGSASVVQAMGGMMMLLLAIFALPALMRFMVPLTAAVAGGSAGMGSSVADPGGMATGAINIGSSGAGFGSGRGAGSSAGGGAGAGASGAIGASGATGAQTVGAKAAGAVAGPAGIGLAAARKAGGSLAGAAAHSAGESGGGAITPASARGPMSGRSGSRSHRTNSPAHQRTPDPVGPTGAR
jgi:type IV secretion system protein TrbL